MALASLCADSLRTRRRPQTANRRSSPALAAPDGTHAVRKELPEVRNDPETSGGVSWLDAVLYDSGSVPIMHMLPQRADPVISDDLPKEIYGRAATIHG
jgi:hypothetical protein